MSTWLLRQDQCKGVLPELFCGEIDCGCFSKSRIIPVMSIYTGRGKGDGGDTVVTVCGGEVGGCIAVMIGGSYE